MITEKVKMKIGEQKFTLIPENLISYSEKEDRVTWTYLYEIHLNEKELFSNQYILQIHKVYDQTDEYSIINKDKALSRHEKYHDVKLKEIE